jgi:hypothetical protein
VFSGLPGGRREQPRARIGFLTVIVAAVTTIGLLLVLVVHKDSQLPTAKDCPPAAVVDSALGTRVMSPSAVSEGDLLGCFYQQGADAQAVAVSFAVPSSADHPCRRRPRLQVSGDEACDVTGTPGTNASGASLIVEAGTLQDQFSTDAPNVPFSRLERLAGKVLAVPPPPVDTVRTTSAPTPGRARAGGGVRG